MASILSVDEIADQGAGITDTSDCCPVPSRLESIRVVDDSVSSVGIEEKTVRDGIGVREISGDDSGSVDANSL